MSPSCPRGGAETSGESPRSSSEGSGGFPEAGAAAPEQLRCANQKRPHHQGVERTRVNSSTLRTASASARASPGFPSFSQRPSPKTPEPDSENGWEAHPSIPQRPDALETFCDPVHLRGWGRPPHQYLKDPARLRVAVLGKSPLSTPGCGVM